MKQDIKDGKNISVGDITVVNEGVSLAEQQEEKEVQVAPAEEENQTPVAEITPDVVVGEDNNDDVVPIPIPEVDNTDNVVPIPIPEVDNAVTSSASFESSTPPSVTVPDVNDGVVFPEIPSTIPTSTTPDFNVPSFDFNGGMPSAENNLNSNVDSYDNNSGFASMTNNDVPSFSQNFAPNNSYNDNFSGYNVSQEYNELPVNIQNAIRLLENTAAEMNKLKRENDSLLRETNLLKEENGNLKNSNVALQNQMANMQSSLAQAQAKMLDIFGLGGMNNNMQANNPYRNFNDDQNNNSMNMSA